MSADFRNYKHIPAHNERGTQQEINGPFGRVIQWDDDTLSVYVVGGTRFSRLVKLSGVREELCGNGEGSALVPNEMLDAACKLIGAAKKRRTNMTDEQKQASRERLLAMREKQSAASL